MASNTVRKRKIKARLYARQGGRCYKCDGPMLFSIPEDWQNKTPPRTLATFDHVHARALGGTNGQDNLMLACWHCNNRKARDEAREVDRRRADVRSDAMQREIDAYGAGRDHEKPLATLADVWAPAAP